MQDFCLLVTILLKIWNIFMISRELELYLKGPATVV